MTKALHRSNIASDIVSPWLQRIVRTSVMSMRLTGASGGRRGDLVNTPIAVPSEATPHGYAKLGPVRTAVSWGLTTDTGKVAAMQGQTNASQKLGVM